MEKVVIKMKGVNYIICSLILSIAAIVISLIITIGKISSDFGPLELTFVLVFLAIILVFGIIGINLNLKKDKEINK